MQRLLSYPEVKSWRSLMQAFRYIISELEKGLQEEGCSVSRFQILFLLYFNGPHTQSDLSREFLVTRGNMSTFCRRLESDGLIEPDPESELKRPPWRLTRDGQKYFERIFPSHIRRVRNVVPVLPKTCLGLMDEISTQSSE